MENNNISQVILRLKRASVTLLCTASISMLTACGGGGDSKAVDDINNSTDFGGGTSSGSDSGLDSALYGGGPFYFGGQVTMDELKHSGFTTINFWTIHVNSNGDLVYNDQLIVHDGEYVGKASWPAEIASLKVMPTSIDRVQFGVASYGVPDFERIQALISSAGTGSNSILYKNFQALKTAIPTIDAIDFDDESNYHTESAVKFGVMLADLGYKVTFAPYTAKSFWADTFEQINNQRPGTVDRVHVQGYDGGSGNQPGSWNSLFADVKVSMGLWSLHGDSCTSGQSPSQIETEFRGWSGMVAGGFIWLYDDVKKCNGSTGAAEYAAAINDALGINEISASRADKPSPENDATFVELNPVLTWEAGFSAISHDVYLGTSAELGVEQFKGNQTSASYQTTNLEADSTYYWRVDQVTSNGVVTGDVWHFSTLTPGVSLHDRTDETDGLVSARGENEPNEVAEKAFDNDPATKWLDFASNSWIQYQFSNEQRYTISEYTITSANDSPERDPKDWVFSGSNDGINWQQLDVRNQQDFSERFEKRRFSFNNDVAYSYYQLELNNHSGGLLQVAEIELIEYVTDE